MGTSEYDAFRDFSRKQRAAATPLRDEEHGYGYALGSDGNNAYRVRNRRPLGLGYRARMVAVDFSIVLVTAGMCLLAGFFRGPATGLLALSAVTIASLWFRHQRMEHERNGGKRGW